MKDEEYYERSIVHPPKEKLRLFVEQRLDVSEIEIIERHLKECEFCHEFCDNYRIYLETLDQARKEDIPKKAWEQADRLFRQAWSSNIIPLLPLTADKPKAEYVLAADGQEKAKPAIQCLATMYSEDPEIVLRVMRESRLDHDYLQLISDDSDLISHVMIQLPDLNQDFVTNEEGIAAIENEPIDDYEKIKWQIKTPDAIFNLEPLAYDPDKTERSRETILETLKKDRIRITFEDKTVGKQITLQILELEGRTDFDNIRVLISQQKVSQLISTRADGRITFEITDPKSPINIRLFQ